VWISLHTKLHHLSRFRFLCFRDLPVAFRPDSLATGASATERSRLSSNLDRLERAFLFPSKLPQGRTFPPYSSFPVVAASMRLFGRKGSKPQVSPSGSQPNSSNGSLRSPGPTPNGSRPTSFPDVPLPKAPDPSLDPAGYLRSIYAVRERSKLVLEKAKKNQLKHFTVDMSKFGDVASFVVSIIKVRRQSIRKGSMLKAPSNVAAARLCARLRLNSPSRPMAAFRCGRPTAN
jgi:hypothetical protein